MFPSDLADKVISDGQLVTVSGHDTLELLDQGLVVSGCTGFSRKDFNPMLGILAALFTIRSLSKPMMLKNWAYGVDAQIPFEKFINAERVGLQLWNSIRILKKDPVSRRAIIFLGRPLDKIDQRPCVSSVQYIIRNNILYSIVYLRSWDLIKELPHDIISWGYIGQIMAQCLGLPELSTTFRATSAHVYLDDIPLLSTMEGYNSYKPIILETYADYVELADTIVSQLDINDISNWTMIMERVILPSYDTDRIEANRNR